MIMGHALKVKKPTELREKLFETLEKSSEGDSFLIHHKSGNSVLQGEDEYLDQLEQIEALKAINRGLQDYLDGKVHSHTEIREHMKSYARKRIKK
jgi:hypothetical protein